ncbi:M24 family metallopeptidase [Candidatus Falkowbacteria bacterium]|uniref:Methionine aminopeptidase n=1 Tax=Candidatus Falkowbacteria bacterium CG10_big_fil_rev_8_21_14_0_10_37_18 TaxID=1974562 RepID=A0A2H0VAW9_9BACT|nr:M24 family metallopeptidase [Candidatus Falkowbacteria bacterium]NCQ12523.1 M24 family metallopeptidase [Candidatus Falkowbacteria bacterium]PIR95509.1 MAG: type I methionyl aminopeptidase [Candidatus Falkowbacteria bacterium CG10_big_fil_rev_8_21_14_0_10_37_18]
MIYLKTTEEIRILKEGGRRLAAILRQIAKATKVGVRTADLEILANKLIKETGGYSAFKNYPMGGGIFFPSTLCVSINNEVVHGAALPNRIIKSGDIVDLDIGMEWPVTSDLRAKFKAPRNPHSQRGGFFTDTCLTVGVGKVSDEAKKLLKITERCLALGIKAAKPGNTLNDIARAVQGLAEKNGYGVVRDLVGHGVGYFPHEKPDVFNFEIRDNSPDNLVLKSGMVIAIEPMINAGDWRVTVADNDYTILTEDDSLSAHFEHTLAITEKGCEILTK